MSFLRPDQIAPAGRTAMIRRRHLLPPRPRPTRMCPGLRDEMGSFDRLARARDAPRLRATLPEATFVALAGDEVVGYAKFSLTRGCSGPRSRRTTAGVNVPGVAVGSLGRSSAPRSPGRCSRGSNDWRRATRCETRPSDGSTNNSDTASHRVASCCRDHPHPPDDHGSTHSTTRSTLVRGSVRECRLI